MPDLDSYHLTVAGVRVRYPDRSIGSDGEPERRIEVETGDRLHRLLLAPSDAHGHRPVIGDIDRSVLSDGNRLRIRDCRRGERTISGYTAFAGAEQRRDDAVANDDSDTTILCIRHVQ